MNRLEMTLEETSLVQSILRGYLASLEAEIGRTDRAAFKRMLRERRSTVSSLLDRCSEDPVAEGAADIEIDVVVTE